MIIVLAALGAAVGAIPSSEQSVDSTTTWRASHTLLLSSTSIQDSIFSDPVAFNQMQLFATTGEVPRRVAERIGYAGVPASLAAQVSVTIDTSSAALRISTTQATADQSVLVADAFADELIGYLAERQDTLQTDRVAASLQRLDGLQTDVDAAATALEPTPDDPVLQAQLNALTRQYEAEYELYRKLQEDRGQLQLTTLERAQPIAITDSGLSAPKSRVSRGALAAVVGAILGLGVAILWARNDRRLRTRDRSVRQGLAERGR